MSIKNLRLHVISKKKKNIIINKKNMKKEFKYRTKTTNKEEHARRTYENKNTETIQETNLVTNIVVDFVLCFNSYFAHFEEIIARCNLSSVYITTVIIYI